MQTLEDIQQKIFFETKNILNKLGDISTPKELVENQNLFYELSDKVSFLKVLDQNRLDFEKLNHVDTSKENREEITFIEEQLELDDFTENDFHEDRREEVVCFNESSLESSDHSKGEVIQDSDPKSEVILGFGKEEKKQEIINRLTINPNMEVLEDGLTHEEKIAQKEKEFNESEDRRRKIMEFEKPSTQTFKVSEEKPDDHHEITQQQAEKKFKLANIKGLRAVHQLFADEDLEEENVKIENKIEVGSLVKSNVKTDFMEAEKPKIEFRLDLNDKVAFTKSLFAGNEEDLKMAIQKLNNFKTLEEAKQYLSEIYYEKNWKKSDEYAQRLWFLVESKFL